MALLLDAELHLTLLLLQGVPPLQGVGHLGVTLACLLKGSIGCGNAGGFLEEVLTGVDFLLDLVQLLACTALLELQAILLGADGLLQRRLTLVQRGVFLSLGAINALLLSELLQDLISCQDRALLLQNSFIIS